MRLILVAVDLDQPLVADAEVVGDLVQHDVPYPFAQQLGIVSVEPFERAAVNRDLVRERPAVADAAPRERHALIEAEERPAPRWFVVYDDLDVGDPIAQRRRERIKCGLNDLLEVSGRIVAHAREGNPPDYAATRARYHAREDRIHRARTPGFVTAKPSVRAFFASPRAAPPSREAFSGR